MPMFTLCDDHMGLTQEKLSVSAYAFVEGQHRPPVVPRDTPPIGPQSGGSHRVWMGSVTPVTVPASAFSGRQSREGYGLMEDIRSFIIDDPTSS